MICNDPVMKGANLSELVAELRGLTRGTGALSEEEMASLNSLLALPVYSNDPALAQSYLLADLTAAIGSVLNREDQIIAEHLFRLRDADKEIGERQKAAVKMIPLADPRQIRYPREDWVLGQLAYALFAKAMSPERSGWHHGDGYVFTEFTIDTYPNDALTTRTTRYTFTIRALRDRVEFYKFGTIVKGSRKVGDPRLLSASKVQQHIASVPADQRSPGSATWHIVRFSPKLLMGAEPTVTLEEDTEVLEPRELIREAGLTVAGLDPVARQIGLTPTATLRVHIPRSIVPRYDRNRYNLVSDLMDRPEWTEPVERADDSPMSFQPVPVIPERRYVVDWSASIA